jgi:hypothetical protein
MNKNQKQILNSLYEMDEDILINEIINFEILHTQNETNKDYYDWPDYSYESEYFRSKGLDCEHMYVAGISDKPFRKLHQIYEHAHYLKHQVLERLHYENVMSHIDECIKWSGHNKKKITKKEIDEFLIKNKIRLRYKISLKHYFYLQANERLLQGLYSREPYDSNNDPYVLEYLSNRKPFTNPINTTKFKFKGKVYPRKNFVLAIAKEYISQHHDATLESLNNDFRVKNKWGWPFEFFYDYDEVIKRGLELHTFFEDAILLKNGQRIVVTCCSDYFIVNNFKDKAIQYGFDIEVVE